MRRAARFSGFLLHLLLLLPSFFFFLLFFFKHRCCVFETSSRVRLVDDDGPQALFVPLGKKIVAGEATWWGEGESRGEWGKRVKKEKKQPPSSLWALCGPAHAVAGHVWSRER